jgi:MFS family permease
VLENPVALLRRLPAPVRLLVWGTLVNKLGTFIFPYLSLVLMRDFHLSPAAAGLLMTSYGLGAIASVLVGGVLTDRLGRRQTLLLSMGGGGALAVAMGAAPSLTWFVPLLIAFGFLADLYRPASSALVSDLLPPAERALGFAALRTAVNLGFAVGVVLGGVLADVGWRWLFVGDGLTTLACAAVLASGIPETKPAVPAAIEGAPPTASPWRDGVFLTMVASSTSLCLMFFSFVTVLPLTVTEWAGYPAWVYGVLMAMNGTVIALFEISATHALRGHRRLRLAALGALCTAVGFGFTGVFPHWAWFVVTGLFWTVGEILFAPQQMGFVADWAPKDARGRYISLYQASWTTGFALNPLLFLPLHGWLGDRLFWPVLGSIAIPSILLLLHLDRTADRPELLRGV